MHFEAKAVILALLLAYRALAVPVRNDQRSQVHVQSVIDALKAQVKDLHLPLPSSAIEEVEAALRVDGALHPEHIAALNQRIGVMMAANGLDSESIGMATIDYLTTRGVFAEPSEKSVREKALYVTSEMINEVLGKGGNAVKRDCPNTGRMCGGCVIL